MAESVRMPWGKHRGKPLLEVPISYLAWVLEACTLTRGLRQAIAADVVRRLNLPQPEPPPPPGPLPVALRPAAREIVQAGFRAAAIKAHPDQGGTNEAMRQVLEAKEALERVVS
jgi:hypothetical protein